MRDLEATLSRALAEHDCSSGADADDIAATEARLGVTLPEDLKRVLRAANGIRFWAKGDYPCELLPLGRIDSVNNLMKGPAGPPGIIAFLQAQADFVGIDLDPSSNSYMRVIDCFHETFPHELPGICDSVHRTLDLILDSNGEEWCWPAVLEYARDFAE